MSKYSKTLRTANTAASIVSAVLLFYTITNLVSFTEQYAYTLQSP